MGLIRKAISINTLGAVHYRTSNQEDRSLRQGELQARKGSRSGQAAAEVAVPAPRREGRKVVTVKQPVWPTTSPEPTNDTPQRWSGKAWVIIGAFLFGAWLLLWLVPGIFFNGSVSQVRTMCSSAPVQSLFPSSCSQASGLAWVLYPLLGISVGALIKGAWRCYHHDEVKPGWRYGDELPDERVPGGIHWTEPPKSPKANNERIDWAAVIEDGRANERNEQLANQRRNERILNERANARRVAENAQAGRQS